MGNGAPLQILPSLSRDLAIVCGAYFESRVGATGSNSLRYDIEKLGCLCRSGAPEHLDHLSGACRNSVV